MNRNWQNGKLALIIALLAAWGLTAIFITPLFGTLFRCGCDWLWAGAATRCVGLMDASGHHHCPWCIDYPTGMLIPIIVIALVQTIVIVLLWWRIHARIPILLVAALIAFLLAGLGEAIIHSWLKGYPLF
ncbi:MAG: hypothetical protein AB1489_11380 [Acidobacteriota bacterium]